MRRCGLVDGIEFPNARPRVMHAERTFWEKATAIHVFCLQERLRGERFSRHWHDIVRLDDIGVADSAIADRELAKSVAQHKSMFFAEKAADKTPIDYEAAVGRGLQLTPSGAGGQLSNRTTRGCLKTAFFSMRPRPSTNSSLDA